MAEIRRKLVIVGDGACGKTCLLMFVASSASALLDSANRLLRSVFSKGTFPEVRDNISVIVVSQQSQAQNHCPRHTQHDPVTPSTNPPALQPVVSCPFCAS